MGFGLIGWLMMSSLTLHPGVSINKPTVIVVDGSIGAGKTTYINIISSKLQKKGKKVTIVKEPVDKWIESGILQKFYEDPQRWAYHFQTKAFHDRVMENNKQYDAHQDSDVFILERSPFTDNLFMDVLKDDGMVTDMEYDHYREWWSMWYKVMPYEPSLFIYLKPDTEECLRRTLERSRTGETTTSGENNTKKAGVTLEYLRKLEAKHDQFFKEEMVDIGGKTIPRVIVCSNENYRDVEGIKDKFVIHFENILKTLEEVRLNDITVTNQSTIWKKMSQEISKV